MDQQSPLWMVVGLGNPGPEYAETRHNVGFMVLDHLQRQGRGPGWRPQERFRCEWAPGRLAGEEVVLVKPLTFMNLSGECVAPLASFHRVAAERIVAVHDDVDLQTGRLKVKWGGGDGGHKGIRSMTAELGTPGFYRIRCGVGRPADGDVVQYVLGGFEGQEQELLQEQIARAADAISTLMRLGLREAMNRFNRRPAVDTADDGDTGPAGQGQTTEQAG